MAEATNIGINLDESSIKILKKVDSIHRDSLINVGLALVAKTGYYKTLTGISDAEDLEDIASLDILDDEETPTKKVSKAAKSKKAEPEVAKKPATTWDSF